MLGISRILEAMEGVVMAGVMGAVEEVDVKE